MQHEARRAAAVLTVIGALAACALPGCRSTGPAPDDACRNPDARVMELRDAWQERPCSGQYADAPCDSGPPSKELLRRQGENLAYTHPRHVPTLMFSALTAYEAHDNVRAIEHLDDVLSLVPDHADAAQLRSRIALEEGNVVYARRLLEEQVALNPDHAGLHEALASMRFMRNDHDGALVALDAAERLGAPGYRVAYNRGLVEEARGNTEIATGHYRQALERLPRWAPALSRLRGLERGAPDSIQPLAAVRLAD